MTSVTLPEANAAVLKRHHIETRLNGGRLEALDVFTTPELAVETVWVDVHEWRMSQVLAWLGY